MITTTTTTTTRSKKKLVAVSVAALVLSAGAVAVYAATNVTLDLRPYSDAPAANHANRFDGFGYLQSALLDHVGADVDAALAAGSTRPVAELADEAWRGVNQSPSTWHPYCVCVQQEGCPCEDFFKILTGIPPEELDAQVHAMLAETPASRPTRAQILDSARTHLSLSDPAGVTRGYDAIAALVDAVARGSTSPSDFYRQIELQEWSWSTGMRGDDRDFLLESAVMARHIVQYGDDTGCDDAPDCVNHAILGATLGGWGGALILGGGCLVSKLPWYPE